MVAVRVLTIGAAAIAVLATFASAADLMITKERNGTDASVSRRLAAYPFYQLCGVDLAEPDSISITSRSPEACPSLCENSNHLCDAVTWTNYHGGTCWLKTMGGIWPSTTSNVGAATYVKLLLETSAAAMAGVPVLKQNGVDLVGHDIGTTRGATIDVCLWRCTNTPNCFAATWTDYNGGTCWFKGRASTFVAKAGAASGYIARKSGSFGACPPLRLPQ